MRAVLSAPVVLVMLCPVALAFTEAPAQSFAKPTAAGRFGRPGDSHRGEARGQSSEASLAPELQEKAILLVNDVTDPYNL